jgi:hypothetical protein
MMRTEGNEMEASLIQFWNAPLEMVVMEFGIVTETK